MANLDYDETVRKLDAADAAARCRPAMEHILDAERAYARLRAHCGAHQDYPYACQANLDMQDLIDRIFATRPLVAARCLRAGKGSV